MATKQIAWDTGSGNITLTYQGQGDGPITVQSDVNDGAARSQTIVIETTKGSPVVTKNLTIRQGACPVPVGTVLNYAYTGSYQEVELPAGQYKLQCWGAQGGSNAAASSYSITAKAGGKGGYSEGILTLTSKTTVRIYVGGQGSSSAGGYNGGGSTTGTSQYNSGDTFGYSKMGGGGGATDVRLSDGALLSRMIVAGGGSGGAMCYKKQTSSTTTSYLPSSGGWEQGSIREDTGAPSGTALSRIRTTNYINISNSDDLTITINTTNGEISLYFYDSSYGYLGCHPNWITSSGTVTPLSGTVYIKAVLAKTTNERVYPSSDYTIASVTRTTSSVSTSTDSQTGFAGGGTNGVGYSLSYNGKQDGAGTNGSFGQGANQNTTGYRYCSGAGGGGWYGGGGGQKSDSTMTYCKFSGGGSGWVNISANAGNRPSGYTGLQLESGATYAGNTSFESPSGGTETGHSGNGYARITRLS